MNLTHSNQTVYVLLAGYQYSYYTVTIILGSQDVTIVTSLIVSNVRGHHVRAHGITFTIHKL